MDEQVQGFRGGKFYLRNILMNPDLHMPIVEQLDKSRNIYFTYPVHRRDDKREKNTITTFKIMPEWFVGRV